MSIKLKSVSLLKLLFVMALTFTFGTAFAQQAVTGVVTSANDGSGLAGATVLIKGTTTGALTDNSGKFQLGSVANDAVLLVSFIGYETQEVPVNGQSNLTISMNPSISQLDEVVVVGYGTVKKKDLTGSVTKVSSKDFNQGAITNPQDLIRGKAAGVQVVGNSGAPGAENTFRIRGIGSIRGGSQPLFVVDGIPLDGRSAKADVNDVPGGLNNTPNTNPLTFINPADIASIEILKDASAAAIYGARGANGVVIITTKSSQSGAPRIDFQANAGVSSLLRAPDYMDGNQYREALTAYGRTNGDFGSNVDALDSVLQTGITQNYAFSLTGGTERGNYRVSAAYFDQTGIVQKSGLRKYNGSFKGSFKFLKNDRLRVDVNLIASQNNQQFAPVTNNAGFEGSLIGQALQWNPTQPLRLANGDFDQSTSINPMAMLSAYDGYFNNTRILASIRPTVNIVEGLDYSFQYSVDDNQGVTGNSIKSFVNLQDIFGDGWATLRRNQVTTQQFTHTLNYNADLSSSVSLNALAGYEYLRFDNRGFGMTAQGFITDEIDLLNLFEVTPRDQRDIFSFADPLSELQSFFGRANVNVLDKYLFTATVRADGSSKFGENNRYGVFPSFAFAWNIANEAFVPSNINDLKLRLGYGQTGNQEFPAGASQARYVGRQSAQGGEFVQFQIPNPDLRWESTVTYNAGLDFAFANSRVVGSVDYFYRQTQDLLFNQDPIAPAPNVRFWINLPGRIINQGVELTLNTFVVNSDNFQWQLGGNVSYLQNVFRDFEGDPLQTGEINGQGLSGVRSQRIATDQPINAFFLREFGGLDDNGNSIFPNGDERTFVGNPNPSVLAGINTSLTAGKITFSMAFNGAFGHMIYNNTANAIFPIGNLGSRNLLASALDEQPLENAANAPGASTRFLESGNHLRLTYATLTYNLGNIGDQLRNTSVYVTGQNLFIFTNYTGFDPEVNTNKTVDGVPSFGIEYTPFPPARTILVGVNFGL